MKNIDKIYQIILKYYDLNKSFPTFEWLMKRFNKDRTVISRALYALEREGYIQKNGTRWNILKFEKTKKTAEQVTIPPQLQGNEDESFDKISVLIIRVVMGIVGIGVTFLSIYLTAQKFDLTLHWSLAWLFSIFLVLYAVFVFETIVIFIQHKMNWKALFLGLTWILAVSYSMNSTTEIQYIKRTAAYLEENKNNSDLINNQAIYDDLISSIERKEKELEIAYTDKERIDNLLNMFSKDEETRTKRWTYYITTKEESETNRELIDKLDSELNNFLEEKKELLNKENSVTENNRVERPRYYELIASALNKDVFLVEFVIDTIPAVFLDIIAPIAVGIALFLRDYKKKKN